ncbi:N-acetylmuramic acid 6-phosphate etherase [Maribacter hydrothermalis]|uniref:N-acetylmuramic acid 6-phosphate etherase n=1 Tax=Maribacter hydrothermalis TaxID=1836467 RepID=A0A1B7ZDE5_9FLAO|nr:N-acetylmuramic acid 6-phosphate etherase [Maribacter hydrothermalis]APQ18471.1 N-acetylmuramic acid 6-phosphate etherase [Maribacter hydrothermalis]OBR41322.1 N-acetylmuramic acid 6-phosphate etherase [Maribacter hydrothermalis]
MNYRKITETPSNHDNLELMDTQTILQKMNEEDKKVASAVEKTIPQVTKLVDALAERFNKGGRLFYIGAGTSGRLGILDASEIPPTFGMPHERVIGLIAGGDSAIRKAVENAEDATKQAWLDLKKHNINNIDVVVGIAASGSTPYVIGGLEEAKKNGILTAAITNNPGAPIARIADIPIEINVGPEFLTGSTRMKSGTSQKLVLNMISTALMIKIGRVKGNKMVHMQMSNDKLVDRGTRYIMEGLDIAYDEAEALLRKHGSVKLALDAGKN